MIINADSASLLKATEYLRNGKLVAFPTETVYGLGADATNDKAVASIYAAKGRPQFNPLIIHVPDIAVLSNLVSWNENAQLLAQQFWPGAITLILPRKSNCPVSLLASAGMPTLAVRIPAHPVAQVLLKTFGKPIAAPSANASGKLSPTTASHVAQSLGDKVDIILAGGKSNIGLESTIINLTCPIPTILRPGSITQEQIERLIGKVAVLNNKDDDHIIAPGMLSSHYAPELPLRLNAASAENNEAFITFGHDAIAPGGAIRVNLSINEDLGEAAANLFAVLYQLDDKEKYRSIAVMSIPETGLGIAINDRLRRAAVR